MRRADLAMYVSKANGRGRFSWYVPAMDERAAQRAWMVHELRVAVDRAHFRLHFQPRVDAAGGHVVCAEALLRWPHAQRGMIPPGDFVPAAEDTGLIDRLGRWVLASAMQQMAHWRAEGVPLRSVAVNVSPRQLMVPGFAENVMDLLARYQLRAADVELELTESVFVGDVDAVCRVLAPLRQAGMKLSLDDFGTGYSSLSSLYRLPVDTIKIDHSFVRDLGNRRSAEIMARSIVALAKALRKRVVAEGVETDSQRDHLLRLDCDELQGYLYGRPMPPEELARRLLDGARPAVADSARAS
jgi:EAL domain-containing protein (putative c-di-GMP-specific phosphodiesterase class I)